MSDKLYKLDTPARCSLRGMRQCGQVAHWHANGETACDECILIMSDMNDDNERFFQPALDEIADRYERRRLFIHTMRQPEMRLMRLALRHMRDDAGVDWRMAINEIGIWPGYCWQLLTNRYQVYTFGSENPSYEDFYFEWVHDSGNAACKCEMCEYIREMAGCSDMVYARCKSCRETYAVGSNGLTKRLLLTYCCETCAVADGMSQEEAERQMGIRVTMDGMPVDDEVSA